MNDAVKMLQALGASSTSISAFYTVSWDQGNQDHPAGLPLTFMDLIGVYINTRRPEMAKAETQSRTQRWHN